MSINIWEPFRYRALYDCAKETELTPAERRLFANTENFERVLADLLTATTVNRAVGIEAKPLEDHYRHIQQALAAAIGAVHINRERVPLSTRREIRKTMREFEWVFTTSYDLLVYWAMGCGGFTPFMDHLRFGNRCEFDPEGTEVFSGVVPVYFLHGALHLVVGTDGATWKLTRDLRSLLNQFGDPIKGDPQARPLLVTEGSAADKLTVIEENPYLSHALERLHERDLPTVVFGSSLSEQDAHLAEALSEHPDRPIAISMLPGPRDELLAKQVDIYGRVRAKPLIFFDATTHPLGNAALRVPGNR